MHPGVESSELRVERAVTSATIVLSFRVFKRSGYCSCKNTLNMRAGQ